MKIVKRLIIVCMIIILLLIIITKIMYGNTNNENQITNIGSIEIKMTEESVNIENFDDVLFILPMKSITMRNKIQEFSLQNIKRIYYETKTLDSNELENYYNINEDTINKFLYDCNFEKFEIFCEQINKMKSDKLICEEMIFDKESINEDDNEYIFKMNVKYENEESLNYTVHVIKNEQITEDDIFFEIII